MRDNNVRIFCTDDNFAMKEPIKTKESKMKVKALAGCHSSLTEGKVYGVLSNNLTNRYIVTNDNGVIQAYHTSNFKVLPDIEVGSEWVDPWRHTCTVLCVGEEEVFIKNHTMNREYTYKKDKFLAELKPKPKTVTMYFYKDKEGRISATDYDIKYSDYICKKEIEL